LTPETVHFLAQFIRHQRALMTSLERWAKSPGFTQQEILAATWMIRGVLERYEKDLGRVSVDTTVDQ
jgi:hypothetical protein